MIYHVSRMRSSLLRYHLDVLTLMKMSFSSVWRRDVGSFTLSEELLSWECLLSPPNFKLWTLLSLRLKSDTSTFKPFSRRASNRGSLMSVPIAPPSVFRCLAIADIDGPPLLRSLTTAVKYTSTAMKQTIHSATSFSTIRTNRRGILLSTRGRRAHGKLCNFCTSGQSTRPSVKGQRAGACL